MNLTNFTEDITDRLVLMKFLYKPWLFLWNITNAEFSSVSDIAKRNYEELRLVLSNCLNNLAKELLMSDRLKLDFFENIKEVSGFYTCEESKRFIFMKPHILIIVSLRLYQMLG